MSDDAVRAVLPILRAERDPRLPQYVISIHQPDGWSLADIGNAMGVSRERVRIVEVRGYRQIAEGDRKDLSGLPSYTRRSKKRAGTVAAVLPPATIQLLTAMNEDAKQYRKGRDKKPAIMFNTMVQNLLDVGVPLNVIARAIGQGERTFRRRMQRWGVKPPTVQSNSEPAVEKAPDLESRSSADPVPKCGVAGCPIPGNHVHA